MNARAISGAVLFVLLSPLLRQGASAPGQTLNPGQAAPGPKGRRLALVVGNDAYPQAPLNNAVNDAVTIAKTMESRGFAVQLITNASLRSLEGRVSSFVSSVQETDTVLLFYSGHGIQIDGENYIIPVDFTANTEADAKYRGYSINRLLEGVNSQRPALSVLILDACRNNPFSSTRSLQKGWAVMQGAFGNFIAFATSPGSTASDNPGGRNGLFTEQLIQALNQNPNFMLDELFNRVRAQVYTKSRARQLPWSSTSVIGDFVFGPELSATGSELVRGEKPSTLAPSNGAVRSSLISRAMPTPQNTRTEKSDVSGTIPAQQPTADISGAITLLRTKNYPEAVKMLTALLGSPDTQPEVLRLRALAYACMGSQLEAKIDLAAALQQDQQREYLTRHMGCIINILSEQPAAAIMEGSAAVGLREGFGDAHLCLANAYFLSGRYAQALESYQRTIALQPPCNSCSRFQQQIEEKIKN